MAEDSRTWSLGPAWRLALAILVGLLLTAVTMAWPAIVRGDPPPRILQVEVTSSKGTFFYSPPLGENGGTTYFNNLSGEGAGQIITVTVVVSDDNPTTFSGGFAFGIAPSTNISTSYGITSTWSVTYIIQSTHGSYSNVLFTILDGNSSADAATISFIQDNIDPVIELVDVTDSQYDPDGNELNSSGNWYRTSMLTAGWSFTASITETGSGYSSGLATWNHQSNDANDQSIAPAFNGSDTLSGTFTDVYTNSDGLVFFNLTATDRVGNQGSASPIGLNLDGTPPFAPAITYLPDTDSRGDGFDPDTGYYDDPSIDVTWSASSDLDGSGVAGYYLDTQSPPGPDLFYTGTSGVVTATGNYSDVYLRVYITAVDNVGNIGSDFGYIEQTPIFLVRESPPYNGDINIQENTGGEYLYISDPTQITEGTLFYNNSQSSSFTAVADTSLPFNWGYNTPSWKVVFTPGWGETSNDERFAAPYRHTYTIDPLETTDVFTVYFVNRAGNVQSVVINAVQDTEAPQVFLTDVVDPQYNPDGEELDAIDNWYRTSLLTGGWSFTAAITETGSGYASGLADWDHQTNDANDQAIAPGFNGADTLNGVFPDVHTNSDGTVQVTVVATDHVNNVGSDGLTIRLDGTPPSLDADPWSENSDYLTLLGGVLYYNAAMPGTQAATVSGTTDDGTGSGLNSVTYEQKPNLTSIPEAQTTDGDWSSDYIFTSATGVGSDTVQVTVYDNVGNFVTQPYEYVGVIDQPAITFDDITLPGYDLSPFDPLDDIGNWYAESDLDAPPANSSWWFHAAITPANSIDIAGAVATWDHAYGSLYSRTIYPTPTFDSLQGTFENVRSDPSGQVAVTVTITDEVSRVASDTLVIRVDKDGPVISASGWTESSQFLHVDGATLYFSHMMGATQQTATLSGHADDGPDGAGSSWVVFSSPESLGPSIPNPSLPDWSIQYFVSDASTDGSSPVQVTVGDHLANQTVITYPYALDNTPPSTPTNFIITTPPASPGYYNTRSLDLSWDTSTDNVGGSGLLGYYLGTSQLPTTFYPPASTTASWDTAADGTFTFYLMAGDNVSNISLTSTGPITVDTVGPVSWMRATPVSGQNRILVEWGAHDPNPGTWVVSYDVEYRVTSTGTWQTWLTNTTDTSADFGPDSPIEPEFDTAYFFRARARDYVGNVGDWSPEISGGLGARLVFLPLVLSSSDTSIPDAVFDGFETGALIGWKESGILPRRVLAHPVPPVNGTPPNGGTYALRLGSPGYGCGDTPVVPVGRASIQAYARVPASGTPYLRFDYRVLSYDTVRSKTGEWWDRLEVQVDSTTLARYGDPDPGNLACNNLYDSGWQQAEFNLSAYAGQRVLLTFFNENHQDGYWNTFSYLDNIRLEVGP
ncbi:MAG: hypothetical protein Kow0063_32440 [Anaerolineae bacterium]